MDDDDDGCDGRADVMVRGFSERGDSMLVLRGPSPTCQRKGIRWLSLTWASKWDLVGRVRGGSSDWRRLLWQEAHLQVLGSCCCCSLAESRWC